MASLPSIDITKLINNALRKSATSRTSIFELFEEDLIYALNHPFDSAKTVNIAEMKEAHATKRRGDAWEEFCALYLTARFPKEYTKIWFWKEIPSDVKKYLKLNGNQDNGIDLIAETRRGYVAIQCKFLSKGDLSYKTLSTFYTQCRAGEYYQRLVMTNAPAITSKHKEIDGDTFYLRSDFVATKRPIWGRMVKGIGEALEDGEDVELSVAAKPKSREELRERHLAFFEAKLTGFVEPVIKVTPEHYRELADFCRMSHSPIDPKFYSEAHFNEILLRLRKLELETLPKEGTQKELRKRLNEKVPDLKDVVLGLQGEYAFEGSITSTIIGYLKEKECYKHTL